ncbi:tyrosine protein phosphatase [Cryobacterium sp. MLB-32]|uniref:tyrosine-protein phosphatase n=1 Tax=Cryobacterium sp. MLB-32 TaxID=1529318 RepID=UPI0004E78809|nr:tyrosine-protein phosphatase [Cryobacterium sp. MLB-32]KFF59709.1 tyrosine protein phosphatase [Cryobacterium sp. MLB-32]
MGVERNAENRALRVDGLVNARDLGGLPRRDGTLTPTGVFFRSENIDGVTPVGWDQVREAGIRTVVDLRQPAERGRDSQPRPDWLTTVHVDLDGLDNVAFWKDFWNNGLVGTALYFLPHLKVMPERSVAVLAALVRAPEGGVLFHCMAGRDRTGLIALLLLTAVDAQPEAIVDDYLQTVRLADVRALNSKRSNDEPAIEALCQSLGTTTEGAFRSALSGLDLPAILAASGFSEADRVALATWRGTVPIAPSATD